MVFTIKVESKELELFLKGIPARLAKEAGKGFRKVVRKFHREFTRNVLSSRFSHRKAAGTDVRVRRLFRRSGALARAFRSQSKVSNDINQVHGWVGWPVSKSSMIAWVHEGGVTRKKFFTITSGKLMAVPLRAAMTKTGVRIQPPRAYSNTIVRRARSGRLVIFQKLPGKRLQGLFVLTHKVKIPRRLFFYERSRDFFTSRETLSIISEHLGKAIR